jgi:hypothetical protein
MGYGTSSRGAMASEADHRSGDQSVLARETPQQLGFQKRIAIPNWKA